MERLLRKDERPAVRPWLHSDADHNANCGPDFDCNRHACADPDCHYITWTYRNTNSDRIAYVHAAADIISRSYRPAKRDHRKRSS